MARHTPTPFAVVAAVTLSVALLTTARPAAAQSIIRNPGDHPKGGAEIEPHLVLRPFNDIGGGWGIGLGARAAVTLTDRGFVPTINNSVAIGFGLDWAHYSYDCGVYNCGASFNVFTIPVVMQWNFYLTRQWSVFGEPGLAINFYSGDGCTNGGYYFANARVASCHNDTVDPAFFVGARWHFAEYTTLTMRIGWPNWSVGISFL